MEGTTMETFFISHGRRMTAIEESNKTRKCFTGDLRPFSSSPATGRPISPPSPPPTTMTALSTSQTLTLSCTRFNTITSLVKSILWAPLMLMYPSGEVPVCQLSVQIKESASHHYSSRRKASSSSAPEAPPTTSTAAVVITTSPLRGLSSSISGLKISKLNSFIIVGSVYVSNRKERWNVPWAAE
ncbi:hypothetical protein V2J09_019687 [Rumex salicifolius]